MSLPGDTSTGGSANIKRAYEPKTVDNTRTLYDEWADQYDKEVAEEGYQAPALAVEAIQSFIGPSNMPKATFLDAGCGTGLVAKLLKGYGASEIDGVDLSPGMLDVARKTGNYRSLEEADLSQPMKQRDESYDVVACVGTLTRAHVGPRVLSEFARIVKKDGLIVATILDDIWETGGYKSEVDQLVGSGKAEVVRLDTTGYRVNSDVGAKMLVMKRL